MEDFQNQQVMDFEAAESRAAGLQRGLQNQQDRRGTPRPCVRCAKPFRPDRDRPCSPERGLYCSRLCARFDALRIASRLGKDGAL